ncbi:MAG TPA: mechanosensitive ion channel domain-containing protein [Gaiellaceae bacterium]|nr:mechanosensitive ion channel domain-containing protein [Gaiellaceae bacterium]
MNDLVQRLNDSTPLSAPLGRLVVVAGLFLVAWLLSKVAGRVAAWAVDRGERRRSGRGGTVDTGLITSLKQRETAISLVATTSRYLFYGIALLLSLAVLTGAPRVETIVGASFLAIILGFAAQRLLMDVVSGLLIFFERWFGVGDTVAIDPWGVEGIVEEFSLRSVKIRSATGEVIHVANSEVKAARVIPRGYRELEIEAFVSDCDRGRDLFDDVVRVVPVGPTHFVRRPAVDEIERLDDRLFRIRARAAVASGREWLAEELFPSLVKERAPEGLLVHGPVVMRVDEQANRRFARVAWRGDSPAGADGAEPLRPLRQLREAERQREAAGRR